MLKEDNVLYVILPSFSAHGYNSATELSQSVAPPFGTVYYKTLHINSSAGF